MDTQTGFKRRARPASIHLIPRVPGRTGVVLAMWFLAVASGATLCGAGEEVSVTRAEYNALRDELDVLRAELRAMREEQGNIEVAMGSGSVKTSVNPVSPPNMARADMDGEGPLTFTAPDDRLSLNIRGRIQPRYEYERREGGDNHSSFFIRRVRLDFRGHAYSKDLTFRIMPEWTRTATLRDAWVNYKFNAAAQLRFGQYNLPFAWERAVSSGRQMFVERSIAYKEFEWNGDGLDTGLMLHGRLGERVRYGVGVFGGEGRNVRRTSSDGNLITSILRLASIPLRKPL